MTRFSITPNLSARLAALLVVAGVVAAGCSDVQSAAFNPPPEAASVDPNSPLSQSALIGTSVAALPSVIVRDADDDRLAGSVVTFAVTSGGGSVTGATQTTDANGVATVGDWVVGPGAGPNTVTATVDGAGVSGNPVLFTATGITEPPASIEANSLADQTAPAGSAVPEDPSVKVLDAAQQPVVGVVVTFSIIAGGGSVTGAIQTTNASGIATASSWILGATPGANTLRATAAGVGIAGNPVTFTATGTSGGPSSAVRWSTYLGGSGADQIRDMATDSHGNVYVAGGTESNDFPTTPGAFDRTHDDSPNGTVRHYDVFVTKYDSTGQMIWSTLLGGPGYDRAYAIEVDAQGFVYIGGRAGVGFPVTPGAAQTVFRGGGVALYGEEDGFVCKIKPDGSGLVFCTYFGTTDYNIVRDIDIDAQGAVYLASSTTVPFLAGDTYFNGSYQPTKKAGLDCVVAKLNPSGASFAWATYIGGSGDDGTQPSVRVDGLGNVWYIGGVGSTDLPLVHASQTQLGGSVDDYLAKLSPDGKDLLVGTYLGGSGEEGSETHNLAVNRATGDIYVGSATNSNDLPVTANALQPFPGGGGRDAMMARYNNAGTLLSLSYLGGGGTDRFEGILVGANGDVYASGIGQDAILTVPLVGPGGGLEASGVVLTPDLGSVKFAINLGGVLDDQGRAIAPLQDGSFVVGGLEVSHDFPTLGGLQATYGGGSSDAWLARIIPGP